MGFCSSYAHKPACVNLSIYLSTSEKRAPEAGDQMVLILVLGFKQIPMPACVCVNPALYTLAVCPLVSLVLYFLGFFFWWD